MQSSLKRKNDSVSAPVKIRKTTQTTLGNKQNKEVKMFANGEIRMLSWNVNGIRAWIKKPGVLPFVNRSELDIICFNETKIQEIHVDTLKKQFPAYPYQYWSCSTTKLGYSGTAILSKVAPLSWKEGLQGHPSEGRLVLAEFTDFFVVCTYVPNTGSGRFDYRIEKWDVDLRNYLKTLESTGKGVVWIGDFNVINKDIDVFRLEGNEDCAGGTPAERQSFHKTLDLGFIDTFRYLYPDAIKFSWFTLIRKTAKARNEGWRFDMAVISEKMLPILQDSLIYDQVMGSDHYPIELILKNNLKTT